MIKAWHLRSAIISFWKSLTWRMLVCLIKGQRTIWCCEVSCYLMPGLLKGGFKSAEEVSMLFLALCGNDSLTGQVNNCFKSNNYGNISLISAHHILCFPLLWDFLVYSVGWHFCAGFKWGQTKWKNRFLKHCQGLFLKLFNHKKILNEVWLEDWS